MKFKLKGEQDSRSHTSAGGFQNKNNGIRSKLFFCRNIKTCAAARSVSKLVISENIEEADR